MKIKLRDSFNLSNESDKNSLIKSIYIEMLLRQEVPSVDDITDVYIASVSQNESTADIKSYIISYMLESKNYCFMFGTKSCDCQEILVEDLLEDENILLGE